MLDVLVCPVRGCGHRLRDADRSVLCERGHRFDRARSGYLNLLQPQDRRSAEAGDRKEAALARRRTLERGMGDALIDALRRLVPPGSAVDLGCGEGTILAGLGREGAIGVDLSAPSIELAARKWPALGWVVANADRRLPFRDAAFDAVLSITARKNADEIARLLAPDGLAVVVVSDTDDLVELREILHGQATEKDRAARTVEAFAGRLALVDQEVVRARVELDRAGIDDLLAATYRGARHREQERLHGVERLTITSAHRVLRFRKA